MKKGIFFLCFFFFGTSFVFAADVRVVRQVTDGDTLVLDSGEKVRLIGVDTPEMHDVARNGRTAKRNHLDAKLVDNIAAKAKGFVRDQVQGRTVRLEYDWQRTDKYGRTLAYVYRVPDDYFLNAEIIREGYGFAYLVFPFKHSDEFRTYGQEARVKRVGLWK